MGLEAYFVKDIYCVEEEDDIFYLVIQGLDLLKYVE
jgi:hypothetical protein